MPLQSQYGIGGLGGGNSTLGMLQNLQRTRDFTKASHKQYEAGREGAWVGLGADILGAIPGVGGILSGLTRSAYGAATLGRDLAGATGTAASPVQSRTAATGTTDALAFLAQLTAERAARGRAEKLAELQKLTAIAGGAGQAAGGIGGFLAQDKAAPGVGVKPKVGATSSLGGSNRGPSGGGQFAGAGI